MNDQMQCGVLVTCRKEAVNKTDRLAHCQSTAEDTGHHRSPPFLASEPDVSATAPTSLGTVRRPLHATLTGDES